MSDGVSFNVGIHAAPVLAEMVTDGALSIRFADGLYPYVVMFTGSAALATDLAAAINGVLERHRQAAKAECSACGGTGGNQIADDPRPVFVACECQGEAA